MRAAGDVQDVEQQPRQRGEDDVRERAGQRDEHALVARTAQAPHCHRDRLRPAEEAPARQDHDRRYEQRADRVDVADRVQAQPAGPLRGVVAERQRDPAVRDLVEDQRRDQDAEPDDLCLVDPVRSHQDDDDRDDGDEPDDLARAPWASGGLR